MWCDRFKLLGGESYPTDIDKAISEQTFRFLALVSKDSILKANPLKERTLALNLARERSEDFVVPLNVDGVRPTELGWMLSDLTYIPFDQSWASGLAQLLKKLESIDAPRPVLNGGQVVSDWLRSRDSLTHHPERVWTNLLAIEDLPSSLLRVELERAPEPELLERWPLCRESDQTYWAFEVPDFVEPSLVRGIEMVRWDERYRSSGLNLRHVTTRLLRNYLELRALGLGMQRDARSGQLFFPPGMLPGDRLAFASYDGRKTWVQAVGTRTFRLGMSREKSRYHLSPIFRPNLRKYGLPVVQVQMRVLLTDLEGRGLDAKKAARRRKAIGRHWWNREWLMRVLATAHWLAGGASSVDLGLTPTTRIILAGRPLSLEAPVGIDETVFAEPVTAGTLADDEIDETIDAEESGGNA